MNTATAIEINRNLMTNPVVMTWVRSLNMAASNLSKVQHKYSSTHDQITTAAAAWYVAKSELEAYGWNF